MFRMVSAILAVVAVTLLVLATPAAPPAGIKLGPGEEFKGKCGGNQQWIVLAQKLTKEYPRIVGRPDAEVGVVMQPDGGFRVCLWGHAAEIPVTLKEGQGIDVSVTVVGEKRKAFLKLLDPSGKQIANSEDVEVKTARLAVAEVNTSGNYQIVVVSNQTGGFTLKAKGASDDEADADKLKEKIKQLEQDLADLKAKLKGLLEKQSQRSKNPE